MDKIRGNVVFWLSSGRRRFSPRGDDIRALLCCEIGSSVMFVGTLGGGAFVLFGFAAKHTNEEGTRCYHTHFFTRGGNALSFYNRRTCATNVFRINPGKYASSSEHLPQQRRVRPFGHRGFGL